MILTIPMHNPEHSNRQKVKGSAHDVCSSSDRREEDYWRGFNAMVTLAYAAWEERRKAEGTLTIGAAEMAVARHKADYERMLKEREDGEGN